MQCKGISTEQVCFVTAEGITVSAVAHYEYQEVTQADGSSTVEWKATTYTDSSGMTVLNRDDYTEVNAGECGCDIEVCYRERCTPDGDPVSSVVNPGASITAFDNSRIVNPSNTTFTSLEETHDGSQQGGTAVSGAGQQVAPGDPDFSAEWSFDSPKNNVTGLALANNFGSILTDNDGIGGCSTIVISDAEGNVLWTGPLVVGNGGNLKITNISPEINGVSTVRMDGICSAGGASPTGFRELAIQQAYEAELSWSCGNAPPIVATVRGPNGSSFQIVNGFVQQTGGPHTIRFTSAARFSGQIQTNNAAAFSSLEISEGQMTTVTGANGSSFNALLNIIDRSANIRSGTKRCNDRDGLIEVRDTETGQVVPGAIQVSCIRDYSCDDQKVLDHLCSLVQTPSEAPDDVAFNPATSTNVTPGAGGGSFRAASGTSGTAAYSGSLSSIIIEYDANGGSNNALIRIASNETGTINLSGGWAPPMPGPGNAGQFALTSTQSGVQISFSFLGPNGTYGGDSGGQRLGDGARIRISFSVPLTGLSITMSDVVANADTLTVRAPFNQVASNFIPVTSFIDCEGIVTYRNSRTGVAVTNANIVPCPVSVTSAPACISHSDGTTTQVLETTTHNSAGNRSVIYLGAGGNRVFLRATDNVSLGNC